MPLAEATPVAQEAADLLHLFDLHYGRLFAYAAHLLGDADLAQDVVQQTFVQAHGARQRIPTLNNPRAWLFRIATNVALQTMRRRRRFAWLPWRVAGELGCGGPDTSEAVAERDAVERALARLPATYRAPLLLFCHYGFGIGEMAEAMGISRAAARTRLYRARRLFAAAYGRGDDREEA